MGYLPPTLGSWPFSLHIAHYLRGRVCLARALRPSFIVTILDLAPKLTTVQRVPPVDQRMSHIRGRRLGFRLGFGLRFRFGLRLGQNVRLWLGQNSTRTRTGT